MNHYLIMETICCVCLRVPGKLDDARRRNDHPATVGYSREQAPYSQYHTRFNLSLFKSFMDSRLQLRSIEVIRQARFRSFTYSLRRDSPSPGSTVEGWQR
jgi:hypothetical protein